jgi:uncharacterized membrane protein YkoI
VFIPVRRFHAAALVIAGLATAIPARGDSEQDRARAALQAGEVRPLAEILAAVARDFAGDVLAIELERERGIWIYEVKLLTRMGTLLKLEYNAGTAQLIRAKGDDVDGARRKS